MDDSLSHIKQEHAAEPPAIEGVESTGISTRIKYTLNFTGFPSVSQLAAIAVATATYTILSYIFVTFVQVGAGISWLFIPVGFAIPFALWFGGWSIVIAYVGNAVGAGIMTGMPINQALVFGVADIIQLGIPVLLYRVFAPQLGINEIGKDVFKPRALIFFLICGALIGNVIGALYGNYILVQIGFAQPDLYWAAVLIWAVSNTVIVAIIGSAVLHTVSPIVERFGLTIRGLLK